jgi:hypothetical protein
MRFSSVLISWMLVCPFSGFCVAQSLDDTLSYLQTATPPRFSVADVLRRTCLQRTEQWRWYFCAQAREAVEQCSEASPWDLCMSPDAYYQFAVGQKNQPKNNSASWVEHVRAGRQLQTLQQLDDKRVKDGGTETDYWQYVEKMSHTALRGRLRDLMDQSPFEDSRMSCASAAAQPNEGQKLRCSRMETAYARGEREAPIEKTQCKAAWTPNHQQRVLETFVGAGAAANRGDPLVTFLAVGSFLKSVESLLNAKGTEKAGCVPVCVMIDGQVTVDNVTMLQSPEVPTRKQRWKPVQMPMSTDPLEYSEWGEIVTLVRDGKTAVCSLYTNYKGEARRAAQIAVYYH